MRKAVAPLVLAGVALAASCREAPRPIRIAIHSAPVELDPHLQNESLTSGLLANVYEALTELDDAQEVRPGLAAGWTNPDERTWRFTLRRGARFHDGRPLEAADVVASLERARGLEGSALSSYLVEVESVRACDGRTVEVRTRRPWAALLAKLTPIYVVPRDAPDRIVSPVGTGPYRVGGRRSGTLELVPVVRDAGGRGPLAPLVFLVEPDPGRRLARLLSGDVEIAVDLAEAAVEETRRSACCRAEVRPSTTVEYLQLGWVEPRFRDRRVREAIHLALDRERYVAEAQEGLARPAGQMAVPGVFGYAPDLRPPERDVVRARALLTEAGFPDGFDVVLEHRPGRRADVLARQLAEAGLRVTPRASPWSELYRRLRIGQVGFYFGGVLSPTAETSDVLDGYVHTRDEARGYGVSNHSRYSSPRADALIEAASTTFSVVRRRELLREAMRAVMADLHFVPVAGLSHVTGVRRGLEFRPRADLKLLGREMRRR